MRHRHLLRRRLSDAIQTCLVMLIAVALGAGCAAPRAGGGRPTTARADGAAPPSAMANTDPCALRLHDLAGGLLLYYAQHRQLPPNLASLELPGGVAKISEALTCPVSQQPYIYDPRGLRAPDGKSRLIVYDSVPAHGSRRWAIAIVETPEDQALVAEVVAVPEATFAASRAQP